MNSTDIPIFLFIYLFNIKPKNNLFTIVLFYPRSGHIPVLTAVGESPSGQVLCVDSNDAAIRIGHIMQPMKVMFLNTTGGLVDREGNVSNVFPHNSDFTHSVLILWSSKTSDSSKSNGSKKTVMGLPLEPYGILYFSVTGCY